MDKDFGSQRPSMAYAMRMQPVPSLDSASGGMNNLRRKMDTEPDLVVNLERKKSL